MKFKVQKPLQKIGGGGHLEILHHDRKLSGSAFAGVLESTVMTENTQTIGYGTTSPAERNKVLRNTYWLLALSLVPTVIGAYVGVATGITASLTGFMGLIVFMAGAFGFIYAIEKTKNSALGVPVLLGFTFFMGLMLSRMIGMVLGFSNGASLVMTAFAGTAGVMVVMATLATVIKRDLSGMRKWLFVGALVIVVAAVVNVFVGSTALMAVISTLAIAVFSAFLLYDLKQVMDGGEGLERPDPRQLLLWEEIRRVAESDLVTARAAIADPQHHNDNSASDEDDHDKADKSDNWVALHVAFPSSD